MLIEQLLLVYGMLQNILSADMKHLDSHGKPFHSTILVYDTSWQAFAFVTDWNANERTAQHILEDTKLTSYCNGKVVKLIMRNMNIWVCMSGDYVHCKVLH